MRSKLVRDITLDGLFIAILVIMTFVAQCWFYYGPISIVLNSCSSYYRCDFGMETRLALWSRFWDIFPH